MAITTLEQKALNLDSETRSASLWRKGLPWFFVLWTAFAAATAWWLMHSAHSEDSGTQVLFDNNPSSELSVGEQIHRWLKLADLNFRGAYPWILLAPYVVWLGLRFHLERGRLRVSLAVHFLACGLFAAASYLLTTQTTRKTSVKAVAYSSSSRMPSTAGFPTNAPFSFTETISEDGVTRIRTYTSHVADVVVNGFASSTVGVKMAPATNRSSAFDFVPGLAPHGSGGAYAEARSGTTSSSAQSASQAFAHLLNVLAYGSLIGLAHSAHFYRRFRERERRADLLEAHLAKARLHTLQAQLQPHFLFNALNAVATLLRRDPRAAEEALTSFSELLRLALSQSDKQEITLREDLRFLERYVEIQQTRLGDRLCFEQEIEPAALDCLVPTLLLQPLVENAIRHGIEMTSEPGTVWVNVHRQEERLVLSVEDNGAGLAASVQNSPTTGIGLSNLRARLKALYADRHQVLVSPRASSGVIVRLEIPLRYASAESVSS